MKYLKNIEIFILVFIQFIFSQNLIISNKENIYHEELLSIKRGKTNNYLSLRYLYEWKKNNQSNNDLLISKLGDKFLRNQRFKVFPQLNFKTSLKGGFIDNQSSFIDLSPKITFLSKYNISKNRLFSIVFWSTIEKHSLISKNNFNLKTKEGRPIINSDFSDQQAIGYTDLSGDDFSWIEYRIGDGGIIFNYPGGDISFNKNLPIWSSGYNGQLWLSQKSSTFPFLSLRHNISENWSFSYLQGSLNSNVRDSSYTLYYDSALPMISKKISVHRLDFHPSENIRLSIGESIIYGSRNFEMNYSIPFLPFWTAQSDLSNSDNLQIIFDLEFIKRKVGRVYSTFFIDEWDFVDTFDKKNNRNWVAFLIGTSINMNSNSKLNPLIRFEFSRMSPYVYIHQSTINNFSHHGSSLGHWVGSNGQNLFFSYEGKFNKNLWFQTYLSYSQRGEINSYTISSQYNNNQTPFLYKEYEGQPENRFIFGLRGNYILNTAMKINFNLFSSNWKNHYDINLNSRKNTSKIDALISISIGL